MTEHKSPFPLTPFSLKSRFLVPIVRRCEHRGRRRCFGAVRGGVLLALCCAFAPLQPALAVIRDGGIDPSNLGKGDWIYSMVDTTNRLGGHVASVTNETSLMLYYQSQGIRWIAVKAAHNAALFGDCMSGPQFTTNLVNIAHANGILIFGYNRSYGSNILAEIGLSDNVFNKGADGFVWDAEAEWEDTTNATTHLPDHPWITNGPLQAWELCSAVRSNWPNKFLAHAPMPIISLHLTFPYKEFNYWSDAVLPQIYHFNPVYSPGLTNSVSAAINWSDANWTYYQNLWAALPSTNINGVTVYWTNAIKPSAPIQDVYGTGSVKYCESLASAYPAKDVMEFIDYLSADPQPPNLGGYKGAIFFRADLHDSAQWGYIKSATLGDFSGIVNNIVIDNPDATPGGSGGLWTAVRTYYTSTPVPSVPRYQGNGTWTDTNSFGTNYFVTTQGSGSAWVQFTPNILVPGDYNLYQWHPFHASASASVPFVISYNGGSTTVYANQQTNDGNWSLLGRFNFLAGMAGHVRVTDGFPEPGAVAIADGLKLIFVPPDSAPPAPGGLTAAAVATNQINLVWVNHATNQTGFVLARSDASSGPYSDIGSVPGNITNYNDTGLPSNTPYYYTVRATNWLGASTNCPWATATTWGVPTISVQPQSQTVRVGANVTFSVTAAGTPALAYQWFFNHANLPGATLTNHTCLNAQTNDAGSYQVVITNSAGSITSSIATLTVVPRPVFYPVTRTGETLNFVWSAVAGQAYQLQYQTNLTQTDWSNVGSPITATNSTIAASDSIGPDPQRFYRVVLLP